MSSPAGSVHSALSPQLTSAENALSANVSEESARMQMFVLRFQTSITAAATTRADEVRRRATEEKHKVAEGLGAMTQCNDVVGMVKLMLVDIFDVNCVYRNDGPSGQFDSQLSQLLISKSNHDADSSVPCNLTDTSPPLSARSYAVDSIQLPSEHKHLLVENRGYTDDDDDNSDNESSQRRSQSAKRHKANDGTSNAISSISSSQQLDVDDNSRCILLSIDCSARSRLWVGRKKVRRQFLHFSNELKRQLEVSSALKKDVTKCKDAILEFELAIIRPASSRGNDQLLLAVLPSNKTSKEFGCFITYFISLVQKLVNNVAIEGPLITQFK